MRIADSTIMDRNWMYPSNGNKADVSSSEVLTTAVNSIPADQQQSTEQKIQPDKLELSPQALDAFRNEQEKATAAESKKQPDDSASSKPASPTDESKKKSSGDSELTPEQQSEVRQLQSRDASVRTHEMQHMTAAGGYAMGGPQYDMQSGPDGKQYAIGGHVNLDVSPVPDDPQATVSKAQVIQRAALAPADPSGADRSVAASAVQMEASARMQLIQEQQEQSKNTHVNASRKHYSPYAAQSKPEIQPGKLVNMTA